VPRIVTVGVYGSSLEEFLAMLADEDVRAVFDLRQRRGVRGTEYAWANARRLEDALAGAGVAYQHHPELAPTTELRHVQYAADDRQGVGKRSRRRLDPEYRRRYTHEILDRVDLDAVVAAMPAAGTTALLCVEADPAACHRSIVAARLARRPDVVAGPGGERGAPAPPNASPWPEAHTPTEFEQSVVDALHATEPGDLVTYGELAVELGRPGAGQAVANVLRRAPDLPWWRVVPAGGRLYRTHAPVQAPLLEAEGHRVDAERRVAPPG
jgi:alkylated DNA nucleotide flippase Atl1